MVFRCSLSDSKSPQVSRTRLKILTVLSSAVIWITSTSQPTSKSSRPFNNPLVIVLKAPITIGTIVTFMFHGFFDSLARSRYLSFFSHSFKFILWFTGTAKSTILQIIFFWLIIIRSGLLAGIRWSVCMLKSHRSLCVSFYYCYYYDLNYFSLNSWTLNSSLSRFLIRSLMIFIIKGFRTIVFIFIVISTTLRSICPPAFFKCLSNSGTFTELQTTRIIK